MKFLILCSSLLCLALSVHGQSVAACEARNVTGRSYKDVLFTNVLAVTTQYFSENSVGDDGISRIDASLSYNLPDLFEQRYGKGASTASFLAGFLDIFKSKPTSPVADGVDYLSKVIGLGQLGEFNAARAATSILIFSSLPEDFPLDEDELTAMQVMLLGDAVRSSLNSIRQALTTTNFEVYLNLKVGSTLSFALDTTGSMSGEIAAAKERIQNIIQSTRNTINQPLLYVLSPFNDPSTGPVTRTSDPNVIIRDLNSLRATGGDDFPELALKGIESAILASTRRSVVFMITDASAKDFNIASRVIALAIIRKVRIISLLTNVIGGSAGFELYEKISSASGGLVTVTDKDSIGSITELFTILTAQGQIKLDVTPISRTNEISFTVDSTVSDVSIVLSGDVGINYVRNSIGMTARTNVTATSGLITVRLLDTKPGEYKVSVLRTLNYSVEISGQSTFGAIPSIFEKIGDQYIHRAQPVAGTKAHVTVTVFGNAPSNEDRLEGNIGLNATLDEVLLVGQDGRVLVREKVDNCGGVDEYRTMNGFTIPFVRFFVKMIGTDRQGLPFTRVDPCAITPLVSKIDLTPINDVTIDVGQSMTVFTSLRNQEENTVFNFDVSDPLGYVIARSPSSASIISGSNQTLQIQLTIPSDAVSGSLSVVTVTATPNDKDEFVFITFSVTARNNDTIKCPALRSPAGSIITCSDFNKVGSACELACEPGYTFNKAVNSTCQSNGTWTNSDFSCTFVGSKQCTISGDPHYITFDGQPYDFQGTCIYTTVKTTFDEAMGNLEPFSIMVENEHLGEMTTVSWFKRARITVYNTTFVFSKGRFVSVDGLATTLPFSMADRGLRVSLSGVNVVMSTRFGLQVVYNGRYNILIQLSASYARLVEGLCGNLNGDPTDDITLSSNTSVIVSANDFGNSFKAGGEDEECQDGDVNDGIGECLDEEEYKQLCSIINETCFQDCRKEIPTTDVSKNCLFDLCVTEGLKQVLEQAVSIYADACQKRGIRVCDWRSETDTEILCQRNSHYEHEGTGCPDTCQAPTQSSRCSKPLISGCICNDGYVLSGTECVPLSNCGCTTEGKYYKAGDRFYNFDCSSFCSCEKGFLNCTAAGCESGETCRISKETEKLGCEPLGFATCKAYGDPHYVAFNGRRFDFQGRCTYLLARLEGVSVSAENENRDGNTEVSFIKAVSINFIYAQTKHVTITLGTFFNNNRQPAAKIDGFFTQDERILDAFGGPGFQISRSGNQIVAEVGRIKIAYNRGSVQIVAPDNCVAETVGLCGTRNEIITDTFVMMNGTVTKDVNAFVDSYRIGDCNNKEIPDPFVCSQEKNESYSSNEFCGKIKSEIFANISAEIYLDRYFNDCVFDLCATNGSQSSLESILENLVNDLEGVLAQGFNLCNWREILEIPPMKCPENSHYKGCTTACPNSCLKPFAQDRCGKPKVEGCECNFGYVWSQGECVRYEDCGCTNPMLGYLPQGYNKTDSNCTTRCGCFGPNKYECQNATCESGEKCIAVGDTFACRAMETNCMIWDATYISTFDGKQFNFNGGCSYVLTRSSGDDNIPKFSVEINKYQSSETSSEEPGFMLTVSVGSMKMTISDGGRSLHVDGRRVLPGTKAKMYVISEQPTFTTIRFMFGLTIRTSVQGSRILLTASERLQEKIMGLCGSSDGNPENDFGIGAGGDVAENAAEFGNYWKITEKDTDDENEKCSDGTNIDDDEMILKTCKNRKYFNLFAGVFSCGAIANPASVHAACHATVPPQAIVKACILALCQRKSYLDILENTFVSYNLICRIRLSPYDLEEVDFETNLVCPPNSTYSMTAPACVKTCVDPQGTMCSSDTFSRSLPVGEGCVCNDGLLWYDGKCVEKTYCGCNDPETGFYMESGTCGWNQNCSKHCRCNDNMWECEEDGCTDDQYCGMRQGSHGCHYKDECKYNNGGCSHMCTSSNSIVTCKCPVGMFLMDDKNCRMLDSTACLSDKTIYTAALKEWRSNYQDWRDHYHNKYLPIFEVSKNSESTCCTEKETTQKCSIEWTGWYNTDTPGNCGDDETLGRIQQIFPGEICKSPLAIDVRIKGQEASDGAMFDRVMRLRSGRTGLLCHNSDQEDGIVCPDFEVRFLCETKE